MGRLNEKRFEATKCRHTPTGYRDFESLVGVPRFGNLEVRLGVSSHIVMSASDGLRSWNAKLIVRRKIELCTQELVLNLNQLGVCMPLSRPSPLRSIMEMARVQ